MKLFIDNDLIIEFAQLILIICDYCWFSSQTHYRGGSMRHWMLAWCFLAYLSIGDRLRSRQESLLSNSCRFFNFNSRLLIQCEWRPVGLHGLSVSLRFWVVGRRGLDLEKRLRFDLLRLLLRTSWVLEKSWHSRLCHQTEIFFCNLRRLNGATLLSCLLYSLHMIA